MLLGDEAGPDAGAQVLVEKASHLRRGDVLAALEKAASQDGDGVGVRLHEFRQHLGEADFILQVADGAPLPWQERRERMLVVVVYLADVLVRDNYVRKVAQRLDAMREANWEEREREAGGCKQGLGRERRTAVSKQSTQLGHDMTGRGLGRSRKNGQTNAVLDKIGEAQRV